MDTWLSPMPALAYVNHLHTWLVVNNNSEPISWTDDAAEAAWLSEWVSCKCNPAKSPTERLAVKTIRPRRICAAGRVDRFNSSVRAMKP